jgi:hypothetical protein
MPDSSARVTISSTNVQAVFVVEVVEPLRPAHVGFLASADAAGQHAASEGAPDEDAHSVSLGQGQDLVLDAAAEDRVGGLLGAEGLEAVLLGYPVGVDHVGRRHRR